MTAARREARRPRSAGLTVQGWFRVVFVALAALVVAAGVIIVQLVTAGQRVSADLENSILPAQAQAYRLQGALVDQETGVRGFGITGQADFLKPYTTGLITETSAVAQLRRLIGHDRQLSADLTRLEDAAVAWRRSYAMPLIALARRGPLGGKDLALLDASKGSFDHLRALFAAQNSHLAAAAARDRASADRTRRDNDLALVLVLVVLLLAASALTLVLHQAIIQPLSRLRAASRQVGGGDFSHRIEPTGPADLRAVAADVEAMRGALVDALEGARAAEEVAAAQAADLDAQAAELLRSNAELEQFAYVASHDLQEPLRKVASFCQLLDRRYGDQLDERGRQYIAFAVDGAKRLQVLINDLLTFSRVGRGQQEKVRVPLDEPLDAAVGALGSVIEESGAVIERPGPLPEVMGDITLLAMLWQNLISNGIKFRAPDRAPVVRVTVTGEAAGPGGQTRPGAVAAPPDGPETRPDGAAGQPMWRFSVEDTGIGIPAEFAEKVFIIFQRLHGRDVYPGTGIGLALCRRIVEYHGGEIHLDTSYAGGARVCFTLPQIEAAGGGQPSAAPQARVSTAEGIPA